MAQELRKIVFLLVRDEEVPAGDAWLGPREAAQEASLRVPPRRRAWRRGRWAAKAALGRWFPGLACSQIEIVAAEDGAPEAYVGERRIPLTISISHRAGFAACAIGAITSDLGFDLERVEARSVRFLRDYLTLKEQAFVQAAREELRDAFACLIWSAKECALKALRTGLRRDTRSVEVDLDPPAPRVASASSAWSPLEVLDREGERRFFGYWSRRGDLLLTTVASPAIAAPIEFLPEVHGGLKR